MITFIAYQEQLDSGGTVEDIRKSFHIQANNSTAEQLAERFQEKYGDIACDRHPESEVEVTVKIELGLGGEEKNMEFNITSELCCQAYGDKIEQTLEGMTLDD